MCRLSIRSEGKNYECLKTYNESTDFDVLIQVICLEVRHIVARLKACVNLEMPRFLSLISLCPLFSRSKGFRNNVMKQNIRRFSYKYQMLKFKIIDQRIMIESINFGNDHSNHHVS